jgi:predicted TIM-barrel fold metal-dependent hydrolase
MSPASSAPDSRYASVLCREFNEWSLERWVAEDDRFRLALTVCANDPQGAVEEIERVAGDPRIVCVQFPCGSPRPYGNPMYHPILEACARSGLPIQLHLGNEGGGINPPMTAAGFPTHYIERRIAEPSFYTPHLASFIFEGVFEMWPDLKLVLAETGIPWVPAYVWRMDASWKGLRHQVPWVKKLPSEYFRENVRLTTQPVDEFDGDPETFRTILDWMDGEDTLMYASNYPHSTGTSPTKPPACSRRKCARKSCTRTRKRYIGSDGGEDGATKRPRRLPGGGASARRATDR